MSFARRNSRFSGSTCLSRSCLRVLEPARRPPSESARRTPCSMSQAYIRISEQWRRSTTTATNTPLHARTPPPLPVTAFPGITSFSCPSLHSFKRKQPPGKSGRFDILVTPCRRGADSTHASGLASLFDNVITSSLARATGAPESRPDCLGTQMCRQWLRWRHVLAQDSQELEGHDGAKKI